VYQIDCLNQVNQMPLGLSAIKDPDRTDPTVSEKVAEHIRGLIVNGRLKRGDPLPSYRALAGELDVAFLTVKRGMDILARQGVVRRQRCQGSFVSKDLARTPRPLRNVGLIHTSNRADFFHEAYAYAVEIMRGLSAALPSQGDLHLFSLRGEGLVNAAQLGEWAVDGAVLLGVENDDYLRAFLAWGTPGVVVDYCPRDVPIDYVACDNAAAARRVVAHLAALGHRRVFYASGHTQDVVVSLRDLRRPLLTRDKSDVRERREAALHALRERGMLGGEYAPAATDEQWPAMAAQQLAQERTRPDRPTAVLVESDFAANALLKELLVRGIRVPEDISLCAVAGSDDPSLRGSLAWTYCRFDFTRMGRAAAELLVERCRQPEIETPRARRIGFEFVEGQTVGWITPG
jgi:DNA-binding LacI/PurR family transcriptional regulator